MRAKSLSDLESACEGSDVRIKGDIPGEKGGVNGGKNRRQVERKHMQLFCKWMNAKLPDAQWTHIPNGTWDNPVKGGIEKSMGTEPGAVDIHIFETPVAGDFAGVAIEMKSPERSPSDVTDNQREWMENLDRNGWYADVAFGADEAIEVVREFYL